MLNRAGKQVYLVGGAVRDMLRGEKSHDWDLASDALPDELIYLFSKDKNRHIERGIRCFVVPTGLKHGTVTLHFKGLEIEITTFRSESGYSDGRRPDEVVFGTSIEADLSRRDFTMNAIAYKLPKGPLVDIYDGRGDINRRLIRCVGRPEERFSEDGLRPIRALRFASQLGFSVDGNILSAIPGALPLIARLAFERIRDEIDKIILSEKPSTALLLMEKTGLLKLILPELAACRGVEQKGMHKFDVLDHSLKACDFAAMDSSFSGEKSLILRMAALYHDIGKYPTAKKDENGVWTFYGHERESARLVRDICLRLRYPNAVTEKLCHLIEEHMFNYNESWTDAAVRRFIIRVGEENLKSLYALRRADACAMTGEEVSAFFLLPLIKRVEKILSESTAFKLKDLTVSGKDLIAIGVPPGKYMGIILNDLMDAVIEDPELNTRDKLLEIAWKMHQRYL